MAASTASRLPRAKLKCAQPSRSSDAAGQRAGLLHQFHTRLTVKGEKIGAQPGARVVVQLPGGCAEVLYVKVAHSLQIAHAKGNVVYPHSKSSAPGGGVCERMPIFTGAPMPGLMYVSHSALASEAYKSRFSASPNTM